MLFESHQFKNFVFKIFLNFKKQRNQSRKKWKKKSEQKKRNRANWASPGQLAQRNSPGNPRSFPYLSLSLTDGAHPSVSSSPTVPLLLWN
jgi:hypothetical protein